MAIFTFRRTIAALATAVTLIALVIGNSTDAMARNGAKPGPGGHGSAHSHMTVINRVY